MGVCAVFDCKNDSEKKLTHDTSFHLFPKDPQLREKWVAFCKTTTIVRASRICSLHFKEDDFENNIKYQMGFASIRILLKTAVPTVRSEISRFDFQSGQIPFPSSSSISDNLHVTNSVSNDVLVGNEDSSGLACDERISLKEELVNHLTKQTNSIITRINCEPDSNNDNSKMNSNNEEFSMKKELKEDSMEYENSIGPSSLDENDYSQCPHIDEELFSGTPSSRKDKTNAYFTPSNRKSTKKMHKSGRNSARRVMHAWVDATETSRLIAAVKRNTGLWDVRSPKYKLPKNDAWQEVAEEVGNVTADDAKIKWMNLRVTFRLNWMKIHKRKPGRRPAIVKWRHYDEMTFLGVNEIQRTCGSTSSPVLHNETSEKSFLDEMSQSSIPSAPSTVDKFQKYEPDVQPPSIAPCSSPAPSSRSTIDSVSKKDAAAQVWFDCHSNSRPPRSDEHSVFGEYIASELRLLQSDASDLLRDQIVRLLLDFKASIRRVANPTLNFPNIRPEWPSN
ncbi:uncharacterized protein LOC129912023 [Episyrphus balteatus]|uniref:uncharacterized protein LOC129912023 n=1 Tax=Episyrphus balteatus TaxID=286459 RepID=UPI002484F98D|nr:uncharacterized protein LOC129912023 [Episyrphus balteatus]